MARCARLLSVAGNLAGRGDRRSTHNAAGHRTTGGSFDFFRAERMRSARQVSANHFGKINLLRLEWHQAPANRGYRTSPAGS